MRLMIFPISIFISLLSCGKKELNSGITPEQAFPANFSAIRDRILIPKCSRCHELVASYTLLKKEWIVAGNANESELYEVLKEDEMPEGGSKLIKAEKEAIRIWIDKGARND